ncbi:DMT family transporter [Azotosporobacter soli]|uniref:DMT family transporter n=1 Tax=Azotosporobacter soli TaxID=3055040 RepID=UPI0031FE81A2
MHYGALFCIGLLSAAMLTINGTLAARSNLYFTVFWVHAFGTLCAAALLFALRRPLRNFPANPFLYSAGFLGVMMVGLSSFCMQFAGATLTLAGALAGQTLCAAAAGHWGIGGSPREAVTVRHLPGFLLILAGIVLLGLG